MRRLRWGVLSTASIGRFKVIPAIQKAPHCEVVAIASRDAGQAAAVAAELGIPTAHGSYEALLADPDVDAVYIPLPNHLHAPWAIAAIEAGKHVLCEKPLALSAADAERMIEVADRAGVRLMEAFMYRLHPSWVAVRELVDVGPHRPPDRGAELVQLLQRRPAPTSGTSSRSAAARCTTSAATASTCRGCCSAPSRGGSRADRARPGRPAPTSSRAGSSRSGAGIASFTCSTRAEDDQRVDIYGTSGRISVEIPFNIPPDRPTRDLRHRGR